MTLCVDSGATKADWCLITPTNQKYLFVGKGINPLHIEQSILLNVLRERTPIEILHLPVENIYFYGAGCNNSATNKLFEKYFSDLFPSIKRIEILSDFLGAARALFSKQAGCVAILGTGSICGTYDGNVITKSSNALGYILGDEGSATDLGRKLLQAFFHHQLPASIAQHLTAQGVTKETVLHNVYHQSLPVAYLSSFLSTYIKFQEHDFIQNLLLQAFDTFFAYHVTGLYKASEYPLGFVGSVAFLFANEIRSIAQKRGITEIRFLQYPIQGIVDYHIFSKE
ncbi:MAG: hypothetical protein ACRCZB_09225 [Bacteroidales bacterium]